MPDIFVSTSKSESKVINNEAIDNSDNGVHLFSSLLRNPNDIYFKNQEKEEHILLFIRRHFITNIKWIVGSALLILAPFFLLPLATFFQIPIFFFPFSYLIYFLLFYYLIVATYIYVNFITWYFNIGIVTNIRVIDIDFSNLIYKNIAATKLSLVQDVHQEQIGVMQTFFNYGDVFVQTAGERTNFEFLASPEPVNLVHIIHNLIGKHGGA